MSNIISSAVSGQKSAAPRAPARRRPAAPLPKPAPAAAAPSTAPPSAPSSVAPILHSPLPTSAPGPSPVPASAQLQDPPQEPSRPPEPRQAVPPPASAPSTAPATTRKRTRSSKDDVAPEPPAKKAKRSSARSNVKVHADLDENNVTAPAVPSPTRPPRKPRAMVSKKSTAKKQPRRKSKHKSAAIVEDSDSEHVEPSSDHQESHNDTTVPEPKTSPKPAPKQKRRSKKSARPVVSAQDVGDERQHDDEADDVDAGDTSDPELHEIDPNRVSMFELSHDTRRGKVSEREKKMAEIDWDEVARKRREENARIIAGEQQSQPEPAPPGDVVESTEPARAPYGGGVQLRIVDGQIVEDEDSLIIDRRAAIAQPDASDELVVEEDNDLTRRLNRHTWINERRRDPTERVPPSSSSKTDPWTEEQTERFYDALRMFGTDFYMISHMFAPKTRKQMKLKYHREERLDPVRLNNVLLGKDPGPTMTLEHYARETNRDVAIFTKFESVAHAQQAIDEALKDKEQEMRDAVKEAEEKARQEAVQAQRGERDEAAAGKKREERARKKAKGKAGLGRGRKKMGKGTLGGDGETEGEADATEAGAMEGGTKQVDAVEGGAEHVRAEVADGEESRIAKTTIGEAGNMDANATEAGRGEAVTTEPEGA